jgi:hypothetical protein
LCSPLYLRSLATLDLFTVRFIKQLETRQRESKYLSVRINILTPYHAIAMFQTIPHLLQRYELALEVKRRG